jgi:hypothetical protein
VTLWAHPWTVAIVLALGGCRGTGGSPRDSPAGSSATAALPALPRQVEDAGPRSPPASAPDAGVVGAAAEAYAALEEAGFERRVFRQVLVGALVYPPRRLTWVLFRSASRVRLTVLCQVGIHAPLIGMSLTGSENDESLWGPPVLGRYDGVRSDAGPLSYRLEGAPGVGGDAKCEATPGALFLACHPETIPVLSAGAALVVGKRGANEESPPWHWQPPTRESVASLRCDVTRDGEPPGPPFRFVDPGWPLVFVAPTRGAPGIEWAHENGDMVVQQGAYRWMPEPK